MNQQPARNSQIIPPNHVICDLFSLGGLTLCSFIDDDKLLSKVTRREAFGLTIPNCPATQRHDMTISAEPFPRQTLLLCCGDPWE